MSAPHLDCRVLTSAESLKIIKEQERRKQQRKEEEEERKQERERKRLQGSRKKKIFGKGLLSVKSKNVS